MNDVTTGAVGELLTAAELLQRGFFLAKPVGDTDGYDLLAGTTPNQYHRIQVKTSRQPVVRNDATPETATYRFNSRDRNDSDFYILCCLMHKSFYVVPTSKMPAAIRLSGDGSGKSEFEKYLSAFALLAPQTAPHATPKA